MHNKDDGNITVRVLLVSVEYTFPIYAQKMEAKGMFVQSFQRTKASHCTIFALYVEQATACYHIA